MDNYEGDMNVILSKHSIQPFTNRCRYTHLATTFEEQFSQSHSFLLNISWGPWRHKVFGV
jgi:hypothetical protein